MRQVLINQLVINWVNFKNNLFIISVLEAKFTLARCQFLYNYCALAADTPQEPILRKARSINKVRKKQEKTKKSKTVQRLEGE